MPHRVLGSSAAIFAHLIQVLLEARGCVQLFRLAAVAAVIWYERLVFRLASLECASSINAISKQQQQQQQDQKQQAITSLHLTILSDPQLVDSHTYAWVGQLFAPLSTFLQYVVRWASDTYARKCFSAVVRQSGASKSDAVIWLGDLLDGGRRPFTSSNDVLEFEKQTRRFKGLFEETLPSIYLPGNHDVRIPLTHNPHFEKEWQDSRSRWLEEWGIWQDGERNRATWSRRGGRERLILYPPGGPAQVNVESNQWSPVINARFPLYLNQTSRVATHEIVMVDSLELAGMLPAAIATDLHFDWQQEARRRFGQTFDFVQSFNGKGGRRETGTDRILISHIPLSRPPNSNCNLESARHGVTRESYGTIDQGVDQYATYQNLLSRPVTDWVLDSIQPTLVFSGDNHDHCEVIHTYGSDRQSMANELTLKAFSMTEGVRLPGYARLSLNLDESNGQVSSSYVPCLLPDQISIWTVSYPLFLALIFASLMLDRKWRWGARLDQMARMWLIRWQDSVGYSDEDDDEEWQMVEEANGRGLSEDEEAEDAGNGNGHDDDDDEGGKASEKERLSAAKGQVMTQQSPGGTKRIRFGRSAFSTLQTPSNQRRYRVPRSPLVSSSSPPSSFQSRAWRELRRAAKANEKVQLRDGPLRELAKVLLWPLAVWIWLQLF